MPLSSQGLMAKSTMEALYRLKQGICTPAKLGHVLKMHIHNQLIANSPDIYNFNAAVSLKLPA